VDLTKPIDIAAVNNTRIEYGDLLKGLNMMAAQDILKDCFPSLGIQHSRMLGKTEHGTISSKYNGVFVGDKKQGTVVPRTITVYPVVAEMADEPERYRTSFIADVAGNMWNKAHPFELWLLQYGISLASEELYYALFTAKRSNSALALDLADSFDGWFHIIDTDIASGLISAAKKNYYADGAITRANAGDYLLAMWRTRHEALRVKNSIMWLSEDVGDLYDDWYADEHDLPPFVDTAGQQFLLGTNGRCQLRRTGAFPSGSQRVILTTRENMIYGTDKLEDLKAMQAFNSGNPYLFTATMKYVFGTQFVSVHEREFAVNDRSGDGSGSTSY
jgi:hypothetical protein